MKLYLPRHKGTINESTFLENTSSVKSLETEAVLTKTEMNYE